jgi:hypothetical protein
MPSPTNWATTSWLGGKPITASIAGVTTKSTVLSGLVDGSSGVQATTRRRPSSVAHEMAPAWRSCCSPNNMRAAGFASSQLAR